jgi:hypothetical protein
MVRPLDWTVGMLEEFLWSLVTAGFVS